MGVALEEQSVSISSHRFRSARRHAAIQRKEVANLKRKPNVSQLASDLDVARVGFNGLAHLMEFTVP